jgi:hypothetical protein
MASRLSLLFITASIVLKREREREKKSSKEKVINPGIIPVINNLWLVGYLEIYNYFCITASIFLTALVF